MSREHKQVDRTCKLIQKNNRSCILAELRFCGARRLRERKSADVEIVSLSRSWTTLFSGIDCNPIAIRAISNRRQNNDFVTNHET